MSNEKNKNITFGILEYVVPNALLRQIKETDPSKNDDFLENKFMKMGAIAIYPIQPFKYGYKRLHLKKSSLLKKCIGIGPPLNKEQVKTIYNFTGPELFNNSNTDSDYLRALKALIVQNCNVQNPDELSWADILAHIKIYSDLKQSDKLRKIPDRDQELPRRIQIAYQSYEYAVNNNSELIKKTDNEVYNWLKEYGIENYALPPFNTWARYLRAGRKYYGTSKNSPRKGRESKSAVTMADPGISQITSKFSKQAVSD